MRSPRVTRGFVLAGVFAGVAILPASNLPERVVAQSDGGIHKIAHVVIIMQENRSFDSYFGTYPGVDGIAMGGGKPVACVPDGSGGCSRPYHDQSDTNLGGPHGHQFALADI